MTLAVRLWLLGAVVPALGVVLALLAAGTWFRMNLEEALDRALLAQAAVESVSLFDGPAGRPHLHMATSPLVESVRPFAPSGDLFGPDGGLVMSYPPPRRTVAHPAPLLPGTPGQPPLLRTYAEPGGDRRRELTVTVAAPDGGLYTLRLCASLSQLDASARAFYRTTLSLALLFALGLLSLQTVQARRLAGRLLRLQRHMAMLRAGDFDHALQPDRARDEVAALHDVIAEATVQLKAARLGQERLVADAAHELRTPLTLMRTSLDLALRKPRTAEELRQALGDTRREVDRLAALAKSLLDLSTARQAAWDRSRHDLRALLNDAVVAARAEAENAALLIELRTPERPVMAMVHAGAVRQAVDNLLSNALKFAPRGSTITVTVAQSTEQRGSPPLWRITVRDHGPGIPEAQRQSIFAPFHRLLPDGQPGHGLGLAIAREIAERHGGHLDVDPAVTTGAQLVLELPQAP